MARPLDEGKRNGRVDIYYMFANLSFLIICLLE